MDKAEIRQIIQELWMAWETAQTMKDRQGLLSEIAWLEHKLAGE